MRTIGTSACDLTDHVRPGSYHHVVARRSLLRTINDEAIDGDLSRALRLCLQLGGETGSDKLREWASLELNGYKGQDELPDYRTVYAPLQIDGFKMGGHVTQQTISAINLPDFARDVISEEVLLVHSAPALIEMEKDARRDGVVRLSPPGANDLVSLWNHQSDVPYQQIERLYWSVSRSVLQGVVEGIRSTLVALVAEMKAGLVPGDALPTAEVADQAVEVAVHGDRNRVKIKQVGQRVTVSSGEQKGTTRKAIEIGAGIAGIIALAVLLILNWQSVFG